MTDDLTVPDNLPNQIAPLDDLSAYLREIGQDVGEVDDISRKVGTDDFSEQFRKTVAPLLAFFGEITDGARNLLTKTTFDGHVVAKTFNSADEAAAHQANSAFDR